MSPDPLHDPGAEGSRARADDAPPAVPAPITIDETPVYVGTASWTDPTLLAPGVFYPDWARTAEDRLRFYATQFPLVEVDSTYYALPTSRMAELWNARTPDGFVFNLKAHALMTGQPSEPERLPKPLRDALPSALREKRRIYGADLPAELYDEVWRIFLDAVAPLERAGKLGAVLMQYPRWFLPNRRNAETLVDARRRLGALVPAVELRNRRWFEGSERKTERLLEYLREHELAYVMVDGPQELESSVPPVTASTSSRLAIVRLHGRNRENWEAPGVPTVERYRYLYDEDQLLGWVPGILDVARESAYVHVVFNNCYGNYGTTNAREMQELLIGADPGLPRRPSDPELA